MTLNSVCQVDIATRFATVGENLQVRDRNNSCRWPTPPAVPLSASGLKVVARGQTLQLLLIISNHLIETFESDLP
ncbi:MAG: hypothetical protein ACI814_001773 [Mariniblastus sp.]|jgi:hypothetical protein